MSAEEFDCPFLGGRSAREAPDRVTYNISHVLVILSEPAGGFRGSVSSAAVNHTGRGWHVRATREALMSAPFRINVKASPKAPYRLLSQAKASQPAFWGWVVALMPATAM